MIESLKKRSIGFGGDFEIIFSRVGEKVEFGANKSLDKSSINVITMAAKNTDTLVVNHVGPMGINYCDEIYNWFQSILSVTYIKGSEEREWHLNQFAKKLVNNSDEINRLSEFINKFDSSIKNVTPVLERNQITIKSTNWHYTTIYMNQKKL